MAFDRHCPSALAGVASLMLIDPDRTCETCNGPLLSGNTTGICRSTQKCRQEYDNQVSSAHACSICGSPIGTRNKVGICRTNDVCRREAKRVHDRTYHRSQSKGASRPKPKPQKSTMELGLLPDDPSSLEGYIDEVAVRIMVNGTRHVRLTRIERQEVVRQMIHRGARIRDICDNLHVHPSVVHGILDEIGYECVRNTRMAGSALTIIRPKEKTP